MKWFKIRAERRTDMIQIAMIRLVSISIEMGQVHMKVAHYSGDKLSKGWY